MEIEDVVDEEHLFPLVMHGTSLRLLIGVEIRLRLGETNSLGELSQPWTMMMTWKE